MKSAILKSYYFTIFVFIFITSCSNKNEKIEIVKIDSNTILKKHFYESGKLHLEESFYKNAKGNEILNGHSKEYYPSGKLKLNFSYWKGKLENNSYRYFENGYLAEINRRHFGIPVGKQVEYYSNGNVENIVLSSGDDTNLFRMQLDEKGKINSISGIPLWLAFFDFPIHVHDTLTVFNTVIVDHNLRSILKVQMINPSGKKVMDTIVTKFKSKEFDNYFMLKGEFEGVGKYKYIADITLQNDSNQILKVDRKEVTINVLP